MSFHQSLGAPVPGKYVAVWEPVYFLNALVKWYPGLQFTQLLGAPFLGQSAPVH